MKKLNKLQINSEKLMKNEELIALRGGYDMACCLCKNGPTTCGYIIGSSPGSCDSDCHSVTPCHGYWVC